MSQIYRSPTYPVQLEETAGPLVGVRDGFSPVGAGQQYARSITNGWVERPEEGSGPQSRPMFQIAGGSLNKPPLGQMVGIGGSTKPQATFSQDGALPPGSTVTALTAGGTLTLQIGGRAITGAIVGGRIFLIGLTNLSSGAIGPSLSFLADITPIDSTTGVAIALDPTAQAIFVVNYSNGLVIADNTNPMYWWPIGTGGLSAQATPIPLDSTATKANWVTVGNPTVYYAKLFAITKSNALQIVWSEEDQPLVGYNQTNFANFRTVAQTGGGPLTAICGQNDALYYWRQSHIGSISGQVNENFAQSGVHDSVSDIIGTITPAAIVQIGREIFFLDQEGRPSLLEPASALSSAGVVPIYQPARRTVKDQATFSIFTDATGAFNMDLGVVMFSLLDGLAPYPNIAALRPYRRLMVFDIASKNFMGTWSYSSLSPQPNGSSSQGVNNISPNAPQFCALSTHTSGIPIWLDRNGYAYTQFNTASDFGIDLTLYQNNALVQTAIEFGVEFGPMMYDPVSEKHFERIDVDMVGQPLVQRAIQVGYTTPLGVGVSQSITVTPTVETSDIHFAIGINADGRDIRPSITIAPGVVSETPSQELNSQPTQIVQIKVRGQAVNDYPVDQ